MNVNASEPLADARSHSHKPRCNVSFLGYELSGENQTPLEEYISQVVEKEVSLQLAEKNAEIERLNEKIDELEGRLENNAHERAFDRQRIRKLEERSFVVKSQPTNIATKTEKRLARLDEWLLWRSTHTATYSEIGKYLELGTRDSKGKNTRRQHMYEFSKILKQFPDRYIIEDTGHNNGKRVTLSSGWLRHLQIQNDRKEVST